MRGWAVYRSLTRAASRSFVLLLLILLEVPDGTAGPGRATPDEILRRAEQIRSPDVDYAVDFSIAVRDNYSPGVERKGSYAMIARGKDRAVILTLAPEGLRGGTLLISEGAYWLLLPKASKAFQLSAGQVLSGDVAYGDLARMNLLADYTPGIGGEEIVDGQTCWRLELTPSHAGTRYSRLSCWIAKKGFFPRRIEYYGLTGASLRTARYSDYRRTALGVRSMRLDIETPGEGDRRSTMVFSNLRKVDASPLQLTPDGMRLFRDAAMARLETGRAPTRMEEILSALAGNIP